MELAVQQPRRSQESRYSADGGKLHSSPNPQPADLPPPSDEPPYVIDPQVLDVDGRSPLGGAEQGTVYKGKYKGKVVAVRRLPEETSSEAILQQAKNWSQFSHPNVLHVLGAAPIGTDPPFLVSEFLTNGNVTAYVNKIPRADRVKLMQDIATGMEFLHKKNVIHGRLKPSNVLVAENGQARITDYGLYQWQASCSTSATRYFSPEAWKGSISKPSDVFAYAMTSYEIFTSSAPWGFLSDTHIYQVVVREGERPDRPDPDWEIKIGLNDSIWAIIDACWKADPRARPTFEKIVDMFPGGHGTPADAPPQFDALSNVAPLRAALPATRALPSAAVAQQATAGSSSSAAAGGSSSAPPPASNNPGAARLAALRQAKAKEAALDVANRTEDDDQMAGPPPPAYDPFAGSAAPETPVEAPAPAPAPAPAQAAPVATRPQAGRPSTADSQGAGSQGQPRQPRRQQTFAVVNPSEPSVQVEPPTAIDMHPPNGGLSHNAHSLYPSMPGVGGLPGAFGAAGGPPHQQQIHPSQPIGGMNIQQVQPQVIHVPTPQQLTRSQTMSLQQQQPQQQFLQQQQQQQQQWQQGGGYPVSPAGNQQYFQQQQDLRSVTPGANMYGHPNPAMGMGPGGNMGGQMSAPAGIQTFQDARRQSTTSNGSYDSSGTAGPSLFTPSGTPRSAQFSSGFTSINEHQPTLFSPAQSEFGYGRASPANAAASMGMYQRVDSPSNAFHRVDSPQSQAQRTVSAMSYQGGIDRFGTPMSTGSASGADGSNAGGPSAVVLAGALKAEISGGRNRDLIDDHLVSIHRLAFSSDKEADKLVTAGVIPILIGLFNTRAVDGHGLEVVLVTMGMLAHDPISANTVFRTGTAKTLVELINTVTSDNVIALCIWVLTRLCRSNELVAGILKLDIIKVLVDRGLNGTNVTARMSAWCLGGLIRTDATADALSLQSILEVSVTHLREVAASPKTTPDDKCAAMYVVARISRSIKLAKALCKAGCVEPLVHYLNTSTDPNILRFSARAIGCLMRPNSADISKILLDAGAAKGLARLPQVIPTEAIEPLESFAFAIQRFSCAEWGSTTRKALVEAGVVDSLLAALRTAADEPFPQTHIELALAVSFLGDVGGSSIRKEITTAGGIDILKRVAEKGKPEVAKACNMAVTSITGNLWTRNAASAKTAMSHNWSGGCPDHQPPCPPLSSGGDL